MSSSLCAPAARSGFYQELLGEEQEEVSLLMSPSEKFIGFILIPQIFREHGLFTAGLSTQRVMHRRACLEFAAWPWQDHAQASMFLD